MMFKRILFFVAAVLAVFLFALPNLARAVPGDYDYSLIFSTDKNIKDGRILVNQSAVITATLVDKQGNPVAADSRASWSMRNTTSFGTTSGFEVASDIKSSHLTFLAPNEPNVQATIEAKTKKGGREYTNNYAVTVVAAAASLIEEQRDEEAEVATAGELAGKNAWNILIDGFKTIPSSTWLIVVGILFCILIIVLGSRKKEKK